MSVAKSWPFTVGFNQLSKTDSSIRDSLTACRLCSIAGLANSVLLEKTTFGMVFMAGANGPSAVGQ